VGFVLGAVRFIAEVLDKTHQFQSRALRLLIDMNFLHYAILMFAVCALVLVGVSYLYPAPARERLLGLTFATVNAKLETTSVDAPHLRRETTRERVMNLAFSALLLLTVFGLWIHFR
jgi:SSS family solute:Na+ symporter